MGDGVNIAARLESICGPGGVCMSEDTYGQVRDKMKEEFVDLGEQNLKNITRPVHTLPRADVAEAQQIPPKADKPAGRRIREAYRPSGRAT